MYLYVIDYICVCVSVCYRKDMRCPKYTNVLAVKVKISAIL